MHARSFFEGLLGPRRLTVDERLERVERQAQARRSLLQGRADKLRWQVSKEKNLAYDDYKRSRTEEAYTHNFQAATLNSSHRRLQEAIRNLDRRMAQIPTLRTQLFLVDNLRAVDDALREALPGNTTAELQNMAERQQEVAGQLEGLERDLGSIYTEPMGSLQDEAQAEAERMQAELAATFSRRARTLPAVGEVEDRSHAALPPLSDEA